MSTWHDVMGDEDDYDMSTWHDIMGDEDDYDMSTWLDIMGDEDDYDDYDNEMWIKCVKSSRPSFE
jgi:hypothetical protein